MIMSTASIVEPLFCPTTIPQAPKDPLYSLVTAYEADEFEKKVDLGVGAYRDDNGRPWILPVVRKVRSRTPFALPRLTLTIRAIGRACLLQ